MTCYTVLCSERRESTPIPRRYRYTGYPSYLDLLKIGRRFVTSKRKAVLTRGLRELRVAEDLCTYLLVEPKHRTALTHMLLPCYVSTLSMKDSIYASITYRFSFSKYAWRYLSARPRLMLITTTRKERSTVRVPVELADLFSDEIAEKLLKGEKAENIEPIPEDVAKEIDVIAETTVKKILSQAGVKVSEGFRHALKEWIKLWIYRFYKAAEKAIDEMEERA